MKRSHKILLGAAAILFVLILASVPILNSPAPDRWGYSQLGLTDGTASSPVFFVEVRGVRDRPAIAYVVRFPDQSSAPTNKLDVAHSVEAQFKERTRIRDRRRTDCLLLVGRRVGEAIEIPIDEVTAQQWFGKPDAAIGEFANCQKFWEEFVAPRLAEFDKNNPSTE